MDIRIRIDKLRQERGWSRLEFARKIHISYTALKNWYSEADCMPSLRVLEEVCRAFDMTMSELFADVDGKSLRADQIVLLDLYDKLDDKQRANIILIIKALLPE